MATTAYDVKIEGTEEINFNKETDTEGASISKVVYKMNTLNDDSLNRDSAVRCELIIEGTITQSNKDETLKLTKWSMIGSGDGIYRKVTMIVYTDESRNEVLRQYTVDKMFCIDYDEVFSDDVKQNEAGKFILHIAQREGNHSKDVFAN